jgi:two-component system, NtrC family, response regulator HydG
VAHRPGDDESDLATEQSPSIAPLSSAFVIQVMEGPDAGHGIAVDPRSPRVLAGSSPACDLRLSDPLVSRRHAAFEVVGGRLRLTDLESTNGTHTQGIRILDVLLHGGERIRLGDTTLLVRAISPTGEGRRAPVAAAHGFGRMVGASPEMQRLYPLCERLSQSDVPLVIEGETGTGKELLAEALHEASARSQGPFVVFDCTAVPQNLVESELFGHERGAFTGAVATRRGVFEQAHGGTLLIDEVGDLELGMQSRLLRAIERSEVRHVGGDRWIKVDVRVIAATRRDLDREIEAGRFRDDLFFRLAVARIELPPLRRRAGDIATLAKHFWRALGGGDAPLAYDLMARFEAYDWPGNVRELRNAIARRLALGDLAPPGPGMSDPVETEDRHGEAAPQDPIEQVLALDLPLPRAREKIVAEFERRYIARVLAKHGGSAARAAAASGIARRYFNLLRAKTR